MYQQLLTDSIVFFQVVYLAFSLFEVSVLMSKHYPSVWWGLCMYDNVCKKKTCKDWPEPVLGKPVKNWVRSYRRPSGKQCACKQESLLSQFPTRWAAQNQVRPSRVKGALNNNKIKYIYNWKWISPGLHHLGSVDPWFQFLTLSGISRVSVPLWSYSALILHHCVYLYHRTHITHNLLSPR